MSRHGFDKQFDAPLLGIDEVGVGCIAGPLTACGVVLPEDPTVIRGLQVLGARDSKKLTPRIREEISSFLLNHHVWFFIAELPAEAFRDKVNVNTALDALFRQIIAEADRGPGFEVALIDGSQDRDIDVKRKRFRTIAKADDKSLTVACASIIAKVYRDEHMVSLHGKHPGYGWDTNKGYPTEKHISGLRARGPVEGIHRMHMKPIRRAIDARRELQEGDASGDVQASRSFSSARAGRPLLTRSGRFR
jgi:ribonuclease HII